MKQVFDELSSRTIWNITLTRTSLIMCGLIADEDGVRKLEQLTHELRNVAESNIAYFHGQDPST